jgi:glycosyltransferase involved in cell wall biosynthesis
MKKKLYLIDSINGRKINSSLHVSELLPHIEELSNIETVQFDLDINDLKGAVDVINDNADIVFIVHDFNLWNMGSTDIDFGIFTKFLTGLWNNKNIFVFPTELASSGLIKSQFRANAALMTKIIVASESFRKIFIKVDAGLGVPTNKIKLISIPTTQYPIPNTQKLKLEVKLSKRLVVVPGLLHPKKDYLQLVKELAHLTKKYKQILMVLSLKSHSTASKEDIWKMFNKLQDYVEENKLQDYMRLTLDTGTKAEYNQLIRLADLVVFPHDNSWDMYNGALIDALGMGKAIVAPESIFAEDLVKKTGILLYRYQNDLNISQSFFDACSVILENKEFKSIVEQQNHEYGANLSYNGIAQQYVNQIKRFKFNN